MEDVKRGKKIARTNVIGAQCAGEHFSIECYQQKTDSEFFETWFVNNLLKEIPNGYTAIMDNAAFHKKKKLRQLARGKIRLLFLPPYSPDYNLIEKSWATMKRSLRGNINKYSSINVAIYNYFGFVGN